MTALDRIVSDLGTRNRWGYEPDASEAERLGLEVRERVRLRPAAEDVVPTALLVVDGQNDFCYPEGALFVAGRTGDGARGDLARLAAWGYRNLDRLTTIAATMDEHFLYQIFHPAFWLTPEGRHPAPYTMVSPADLRERRLVPNPAVHTLVPPQRRDRRPAAEWVEAQAADYLARLAEDARYELTIWPYHCLKGGSGQNLAGILRQLMMIHAFARNAAPVLIAKGDNPWTESYSAVGPEVSRAFDGTPLLDISAARPHATVAHILRTHRRVVIAGQALSHCVLWTLSDVVRLVDAGEIAPPAIYVLVDACSAVVVRDAGGAVLVDYTESASAALQGLASRPYLHLVKTVDDVASWPAWGEGAP